MAGRTRALIACIAVAMVILPWRPAAADDLPQPAGRVILTVSGNITRTNNGDGADFDLDMLHALGTQAMSTSTSWTDGTQNFRGVSMRALMATVGAEGKTVETVALNDHRQMIELEDFSLYPVILATKLNGRVLKVRDKGPLWIIYPLDGFTNAEKTSIEPRMVWQLRQLIVK